MDEPKPAPSTGPEPAGAALTGQAIEELVRARARVRELEQQLGLASEARVPVTDGLDLATWKLVGAHAHDFVSLHAPDGRYQFASPAVGGVLGWSPDELVGTDPYAMMHPDDRAGVAQAHARQPTGATTRVEYRLRHRDGHYLWVETASRSVVQDGRIQCIVCITRDTTERRQAAERLEESNRRLQEFASIAAHDLKAPLQTISSYVELFLSSRDTACLPQAERRMLLRVVEHAHRMGQLVDDLLVWSRLESEEQPMLPTDLREVVDAVLEALSASIGERHAVVERGALPVVTGSPYLVQVMVQNLVANAIKFTPADRAPRIRIDAREDAGCWHLAVSDNGRGISEGERSTIFEMFRRASNARDVPGHGIGLALCSRIAAVHGGGIEVQSEPGRGSTFTVCWPVQGVERCPR